VNEDVDGIGVVGTIERELLGGRSTLCEKSVGVVSVSAAYLFANVEQRESHGG
jgi:hypothetical protein